MKKINCIDCNKIISNKAMRCRICANKYRRINLEIVFCKHCSHTITIQSKCCLCHSCVSKNFKQSVETRRKLSLINTGKNHPMYGLKRPKHSKRMTGINNPNYRHGKGYEPYSLEFLNLRCDILKRDNYQCQNCEMTQEEHYIVYGRDIEVHQIDYNKKNNNKDNLITLCKQCNIRANYNTGYWKQIYNQKVEVIYCG